jgi:hypothetical protein
MVERIKETDQEVDQGSKYIKLKEIEKVEEVNLLKE